MFKNVYSLYSAFCTQPACYSQSAVCILHSVCILPLVRSLQSAVRSLRLTLTALSILPEKREGRSNRAAGNRAWWPVPGTQILERRESKRHAKSFLPFYFRVRAFSIQRARQSRSQEQAKPGEAREKQEKSLALCFQPRSRPFV